MLSIHLICVGKLKEKFYREAVEEYTKRLSAYCKLNLVELPEVKLPQNPSQGEIQAALDKEGAAIRARIPQNASVIAMCVEGKTRSSEELAALVRTWEQNAAKHLSPMTFPHHRARVMVLEQVYRAFKINEGSSYHK